MQVKIQPRNSANIHVFENVELIEIIPTEKECTLRLRDEEFTWLLAPSLHIIAEEEKICIDISSSNE